MGPEGLAACDGSITAALLLDFLCDSRDQVTSQRTGPAAQAKQVRDMNKARCSTADPVGILFRESLHTRDDQATFGGVIRHVSRQIAATPGQIFGLFEGESVTAHQHFDPAVGAQSHHHANSRQVIPDPLAHADAVGPFVALWSNLKIVVETVQTTDEGVVTARALVCKSAEAEVNLPVMANADVGPLDRCCSVATLPDSGAELQITQWNGDFLPADVDVPLVHRA